MSTRYAVRTVHVEYVASNGNGKQSKPTTNKLSAQSTAKRWAGFVFKDTYDVDEYGDRVFRNRKKLVK